MKIFIATTIFSVCSFFTSCQAQSFAGFEILHDQTNLQHAEKCMNTIDLLVQMYHVKGKAYTINHDFHMGFILGQRQAYQNMIEKISNNTIEK